MLKRIIESEMLIPITDFHKTEKNKERLLKSTVLLGILTIINIVMFKYSSLLSIDEYNSFVLNYTDVILDIAALLLSFSIGYLTIIVSSEGRNIDNLKKYKTNIKIDNQNISLYQKLLVLLTYTICLEIILLVDLLLYRFIFEMINIIIKNLFFSLNVTLLLNIISIIFVTVKNIYLSFFKK